MSLELTKLKSEIMIYQVEGDVYSKIVRRVYRDLSIKTYKWRLEVTLITFSSDFKEWRENKVLECKNYTRDTLSRRFREWREKSTLTLKLVKVEQFFFTD